MAGDPTQLFELLDRMIAGLAREQGDPDRDPDCDGSESWDQTTDLSGSNISLRKQHPGPSGPDDPQCVDCQHRGKEILPLASSGEIGGELGDGDTRFKAPSNNSGSCGSSGAGLCFLKKKLGPDAGPDGSSGPGVDYGGLERRWPAEGERAEASPWLDFFSERAAHREFDGDFSRIEAERLAWGEVELRWHLLHGERVPHNMCAGCREPFHDAGALDLIDGSRVHFDGERRCLKLWTRKWRAAAARGLQAVGLRCPDRRPRACKLGHFSVSD
jgi:hypothetical protein